ncbi:MAG: hypothetical protein IJX62_01805 [Clostridia bacterium]|nr:hypothetical protein [Clostridia bacterium]
MQPNTEHDTARSYEELLQQSKRMKKKILIVIAAIVGALLVLFLIVTGIEMLQSSQNKIPEYDYEFYPPYDGDIMEYPAYLELNRDVMFTEDLHGLKATTAITEDTLETYDEYVQLLYAYLHTVIAGDADAYNGYFSASYIRKYGKQASFSPQMLYDIRIELYSREGEGDSAKITYQVDYRIFENDGSFRRDVESDAIRPQYVVMTKNKEGKPVIDLLVTRYETSKDLS